MSEGKRIGRMAVIGEKWDKSEPVPFFRIVNGREFGPIQLDHHFLSHCISFWEHQKEKDRVLDFQSLSYSHGDRLQLEPLP